MTDEPLFIPLPPDPDQPASASIDPAESPPPELESPRDEPPRPAPAPPPASFEELSLPGVASVQRPAEEFLAVASAPPPAPVGEPERPPVAAEPPFSLPPPDPPPPGGASPPGGGGPSPSDYDEKRMTLIEHLEELRQVLIVSLSAWGIASIVGLVASHWIVLLLTKPLGVLNQKPVVLSPMGIFTVHLKVGLIAGLVLALPVILQQVWTFVAPGLKPKERRLAGPLMFSSLALFGLGGLLAFGFMFIGIRIIQFTANATGIQYLPELNAYLGTMVVLMLSFGITFEFPVALVLLAMLGVVTSARLRRTRRTAYLVIAAVGYAVTPGVDPVTPLALIVPLLLLYEGAILVIRRMGK